MAGEDRGGGWWPEEDEKREPRDRSVRGGGKEKPPAPPRGLASRDAERKKATSRYSLFVGLAFVALIVVALINLVGTDETGILGAGSGAEGEPLVEFAVVDAGGAAEGDANIAQDDCETSRNPCPEDQVRTPACDVEEPETIRVCDYFDLPLMISFWFTRGGDCSPTQDAFDAAASEYDGRVNFLSVNVRDSRETVTGLIEERGWTVPMGLDSDGAVSNLYRVGACPTIASAYPGGILYEVNAFEPLDEAGVGAVADELLAATREREAASR